MSTPTNYYYGFTILMTFSLCDHSNIPVTTLPQEHILTANLKSDPKPSISKLKPHKRTTCHQSSRQQTGHRSMSDPKVAAPCDPTVCRLPSKRCFYPSYISSYMANYIFLSHHSFYDDPPTSNIIWISN